MEQVAERKESEKEWEKEQKKFLKGNKPGENELSQEFHSNIMHACTFYIRESVDSLCRDGPGWTLPLHNTCTF